MNGRAGFHDYTAIAAIADPAPAVYLHCAIVMPRARLLASEHFRLVRFEGQENASALFEYQLELHGNTSLGHGEALEFEDLIGRPVTVGVARPAASDPGAPDPAALFLDAVRHGAAAPGLALFNGIVASFGMEIPGVYRVTMKPAMHRLTLTNDYRVHAGLNLRDAIVGVLRKHRIDFSMAALQNEHNLAVARRQDWLQAGETDFEFVQRLMGKAHLYFYFVHDGAGHRVVFANDPAYPDVYPDGRALRYAWTGADALGLAQEDTIFEYSYQRELASSAVEGVFARQRACWEEDRIARTHSYATPPEAEPGELPFRQYRIYQYGGSVPEVQHYAQKTGSALRAASQALSGASHCPALRAGHRFALTAGDGPARPALEGQRFVLTQVQHEADADGNYRNRFRAAPAAALISSFSIQETQQGSVLAEVVAAGGDAPAQDWRYYSAACYDPETSQLYDADAVPDDASLQAMGVYVRFSSGPVDAPPVWIKLAPHMQTVPEPGVTVVVARAQDESELPEIQSVIHANGGKVIMPSGWTANSHVGGSYSTSYGDGKSIRFGGRSRADLDAARARVDQPYAGGQYRETSYAQGASYSFACSEELAGSAASPAELFGAFAPDGEMLSASESFGSTYSRHHARVVSSYSDIGTQYSNSVVGASDSVSTVNGKSTSSATHHGEVASSTTHLADVSSLNTVLANSTNVSTVSGISLNSSTVGVQTSVNTVLASTSTDVTGASTRTSLTGASSETSVTGSHTSVQVSAQNNSVQMIGENNVIELLGPGIHVSNKAEQVEAETRDLNVTIIVAMQIYM